MAVKTIYKDLGIVDFKKAWDYQERLFGELIHAKQNKDKPDNYLLFCQHTPVFTMGKSGSEANLLITKELVQQKNIAYYQINRGGDITFHGPGQLVVYPILDLEQFSIGIKKYVYLLEEVIIKTLQDYGINSERLAGASGVWLHAGHTNARKICAIGVRVSRFVSMHGLAFNINTNLEYYKYINPCGFEDKGVTSLQQELGRKVDMQELSEKVKNQFVNIFGTSF